MNIIIIIILLLLLLLIFKKKVIIERAREEFMNIKLEKSDLKRFDSTIVRVRVHKLDYNWLEPFNKNSSYESIGTGFFINKEGYLLTNFHVVNRGIKVFIQIPLIGNKTYDCDIISVYPRLDIALLKVKNYETNDYLNLGDSNNVLKGDLLLAIGYPLGQNKIKITSGIVSGIQDGDIQTDSPINKGNSGGPLLNENNEVIGINYSGYDNAQNIGYAIPINYVKINLDNMYKTKLINFPILGALFNNTNNLFFKLNDICKEGYYVSDVLENGTFDNGNIKRGDILCSFDSKKIDNYGEIFLDKLNTKFHISNYLKYKKVGDNIKVILFRDINNNSFQDKKSIKMIETNIVLQPNTYYKIRDIHYQYENVDYLIIGGLVIMELSNNHLKEFKEKENINNLEEYFNIKNKIKSKLIITHILKGSKVSEDNIFKSPQILIKVNNKKVNTIEELKEKLKIKLSQGNIKYFSFLTEGKKFLILGCEDTKNEELFLSNKYEYTLSDYIKNLLEI